MILPLKNCPFFSAYKTVSGVNGPLVILDDVKVKQLGFVLNAVSFMQFFVFVVPQIC
jgi:hypothetical protein